MQTRVVDKYRKQLRQCARALAVARNEKIYPHLPSEDLADMVQAFTDGNLDKRADKLTDQFEFMQDAFDGLQDWIAEYIRSVPLKAYDIGTTDSTEFLSWVRQHKPLTPEQIDLVVCHESRVAVEETARRLRMQHVRFQDMLSSSERLADQLGANDDLGIYVNPIRVEATFRTTVLLDDESDVPAEVMFYPVGSDVRTAVMEPAGVALVSVLQDRAGSRLDELLFVMREEHDMDAADVIEICRDLAEMGLVAFG